MGRGEYLGEFEQLVILALLRLGNDGYGMEVRRELESTSGRSVTIGAVYATLDRLEQKGLLASRQTEPDARPGGRARRVFRVETAGIDALADTRQVFDRMWEGVSLPEETGS